MGGERRLERERLIGKNKKAAAEVITCDVLIVSRVKPWPVACVCFGDGQTEAIYGKKGRVMGKIREGQRARRGKRGEWRDDEKLTGVVKGVKDCSAA